MRRDAKAVGRPCQGLAVRPHADVVWSGAMRRLGNTDLEVFPLCLGGNVFGWTTDEAGAYAVLDAYVAAGGNFIDTADVYPPPGDTGGVSERTIGRWMAERGNRDQMVVATKVGRL